MGQNEVTTSRWWGCLGRQQQFGWSSPDVLNEPSRWLPRGKRDTRASTPRMLQVLDALSLGVSVARRLQSGCVSQRPTARAILARAHMHTAELSCTVVAGSARPARARVPKDLGAG